MIPGRTRCAAARQSQSQGHRRFSPPVRTPVFQEWATFAVWARFHGARGTAYKTPSITSTKTRGGKWIVIQDTVNSWLPGSQCRFRWWQQFPSQTASVFCSGTFTESRCAPAASPGTRRTGETRCWRRSQAECLPLSKTTLMACMETGYEEKKLPGSRPKAFRKNLVSLRTPPSPRTRWRVQRSASARSHASRVAALERMRRPRASSPLFATNCLLPSRLTFCLHPLITPDCLASGKSATGDTNVTTLNASHWLRGKSTDAVMLSIQGFGVIPNQLLK